MQRTTPSGANPAFLRSVNRAAVLEHLRRHSPTSRTEVAKAIGLAKPTVSLIVEELIAEGLAHEIGLGSTTTLGGRPRVLLSFNAQSSNLVGVHVGVQSTSVSLTDALGVPVMSKSMRTPRGSERHAIRKIGALVLDVLGKQGVDATRVLAGGVCVPGLVSADGRSLLFAPNLGWRDVPLADALHNATGVPFTVYNGAQATLIAEVLEGAAAGADDVALIYVGSGIGAAAYCQGQLLKGSRGLAGELGHCQVEPDGRPCNCGSHGCLETVASAQAIIDQANERRRRGTDGFHSVRDVVLAADSDAGVAAVLEHVASTLGRAASWLVNIFDPEVLVLAGGVSGAGERFLLPFTAALHEGLMPAFGTAVRVVSSELGPDAEVRGVVHLAQAASQQFDGAAAS